MSKEREEVIAFFDDECLTNCYQFIVDEYSKMIQATGRYDLCPYQYAQFVIAAITTDSNFGIYTGVENHHDVEMLILHQDIPAYAAISECIRGEVFDILKTYLQCNLSKEFTDLWCGSLMYLNLSLLEIDGTYDRPIFVFRSAPKNKNTLKGVVRWLKNTHQVIVNHKVEFHGTPYVIKNKTTVKEFVTSKGALNCKVTYRHNKVFVVYTSLDGITVRAPYSMSHEDIVIRLNKRVDWLWECTDNQRNQVHLTHTSLTSAWLFGKVLPITRILGTPKVYVDSDCIYVVGARDDKHAAKLLKYYYQTTMKRLLAERVRRFSSLWRIAPTAVKLNYSNEGLGSCDQDKIIHISWRLLAAPVLVIDYVIAHELAHCIEYNHSSAFWTEVARLCPDFVARRNWFNEFIKHAPLWR